MNTQDDYVVPAALRGARFVPRQAPGRREPLRVTASAFRARGLASDPAPTPDQRRELAEMLVDGGGADAAA